MGIQGESKTDQMFLLLETQKTARIKFNWNLVLYKTHYSENSSSDSLIYYLYLHLPSLVGETSSHLAREESRWFIQVNSVPAAACVDFPYGVSVPLHCIFPTHTLYTAFHVEENHSHLFNFRGQICGTIQREGSATRACVGRRDVLEKLPARKQYEILTPSGRLVMGRKPVTWPFRSGGRRSLSGGKGQEEMLLLTSEFKMLLKMQDKKKRKKVLK